MNLATKTNQRIDQIQQRMDQLSPRDRFALIILTVFLLPFTIPSSFEAKEDDFPFIFISPVGISVSSPFPNPRFMFFPGIFPSPISELSFNYFAS